MLSSQLSLLIAKCLDAWFEVFVDRVGLQVLVSFLGRPAVWSIVSVDPSQLPLESQLVHIVVLAECDRLFEIDPHLTCLCVFG